MAVGPICKRECDRSARLDLEVVLRFPPSSSPPPSDSGAKHPLCDSIGHDRETWLL